MRSAAFVVVPSICFETFSLVICEAFATGTPVIASRLGAPAELIEEGKTGLRFNPGDASDLAAKIAWAEAHPDDMRAMGKSAREAYEQRYSAAVTYRGLLAAYERALGSGAGSGTGGTPGRKAAQGGERVFFFGTESVIQR